MAGLSGRATSGFWKDEPARGMTPLSVATTHFA